MDKIKLQLAVGSQIRSFRKAQHLSQEQLAERAEVHPTFISNLERGKVSASAYSLYKVSQALGIKLADLFGMLDTECNLDFEYGLADIIGKIRQMEDGQRGLYLAAIKGMLNTQ